MEGDDILGKASTKQVVASCKGVFITQGTQLLGRQEWSLRCSSTWSPADMICFISFAFHSFFPRLWRLSPCYWPTLLGETVGRLLPQGAFGRQICQIQIGAYQRAKEQPNLNGRKIVSESTQKKRSIINQDRFCAVQNSSICRRTCCIWSVEQSIVRSARLFVRSHQTQSVLAFLNGEICRLFFAWQRIHFIVC